MSVLNHLNPSKPTIKPAVGFLKNAFFCKKDKNTIIFVRKLNAFSRLLKNTAIQMSTQASQAAVAQKAQTDYQALPEESARLPETLEEFRLWRPEDGYKYEWNNGQIEQFPNMITFENLYIVRRLSRIFQQTPSYGAGDELYTEPESMTSSTQIRIPDMAYYTAQQIWEASQGQTPSVPSFLIEFISDNDHYSKVLAKLEEYFKAGAQLIWLIIPQVSQVYVYTSPVEVTICRDARICSAEPVIPGFAISAADLFAKPERPQV
jgi:Uma2 family endonuclease